MKILDLFWILAGPGGTRMLADYGAEVVHVERDASGFIAHPADGARHCGERLVKGAELGAIVRATLHPVTHDSAHGVVRQLVALAVGLERAALVHHPLPMLLQFVRHPESQPVDVRGASVVNVSTREPESCRGAAGGGVRPPPCLSCS